MGSPALGPPLDFDGLKKLYGDDTAMELLQMSVDEARGLMDQLGTGIKTRDSKIVSAAAHQLKGLAATMTMDEMANLSLEVEQAAKKESWDSVSQTTTLLQGAVENLATFVQGLVGQTS